jgi:transcriptional regulator with XRE-family HTH domain
MNEPNYRSVSQLIRQRRIQLRLKQTTIAAELRVEPESVGHWENGRRRPELDKLPRVAAILQLNKDYLCRLALSEWHPCLYAALFGPEPPRLLRSIHDEQSGRRALPAGAADNSSLEVGVIVSNGLSQPEQLA